RTALAARSISTCAGCTLSVAPAAWNPARASRQAHVRRTGQRKRGFGADNGERAVADAGSGANGIGIRSQRSTASERCEPHHKPPPPRGTRRIRGAAASGFATNRITPSPMPVARHPANCPYGRLDERLHNAPLIRPNGSKSRRAPSRRTVAAATRSHGRRQPPRPSPLACSRAASLCFRIVSTGAQGITMKRREFLQSSSAVALFALSSRRAAYAAVRSGATPDVAAVTGDGRPITLRGADVEDLAAQLRGPLLLAGDDGYEEARLILNPSFDKRPALIAQVTGVADTQAAVRFAQAHQLLLAVKCGGHSHSGQSTCNGGMMID